MQASYYTPSVSLKAVETHWFVYAGHVCPVATAPTSIFRAAVLERAPAWAFSAEYALILGQSELDVFERWWLLCELASHSQAIALYESRACAER
jgi:hypothetical protein